MGISMSRTASLREAGHDAVHLRDEGLLKMRDSDILEKARSENRVVLTFDLDFGDLLAASGEKLPSVIISRLRNQTPSALRPRLFGILSVSENLTPALTDREKRKGPAVPEHSKWALCSVV